MAGKGGKREGAGRKKGSENKVTTEIREAYKLLLENNIGKFQKWIDEVAENNPAKAIELLNNMTEYILPKLQRTELTGDKTSPVVFQEVKTYDSNEKTDQSS